MINEKSMTLGSDFTRDVNPCGWYASEKLWDIRCYWDGRKLWTRGGNNPKLPESFTNQLPCGVELDCGIYCGRDGQEAARLAVQFGKVDATKPLLLAVYDSPKTPGNWKRRITAAGSMIANRCPVAFTVPFKVVTGFEMLRDMVAKIVADGGEGVMIRNPKTTRYETGRTSNLLKIKNPHVI